MSSVVAMVMKSKNETVSAGVCAVSSREMLVGWLEVVTAGTTVISVGMNPTGNCLFVSGSVFAGFDWRFDGFLAMSVALYSFILCPKFLYPKFQFCVLSSFLSPKYPVVLSFLKIARAQKIDSRK